MSMKQISVFVENKPGALYALTAVLAQGQIDMRALSLAETKDFGIVRLIVNDLYKTTTLLKDAGYVHSLTPVVGVAIPDVPGGLNRVLQVLTDAKVNVEYMYAFLGGKDVDHAYMIFRVADDKAAETALASRGIQVLDQEQVERL
ncbi:ACT domain-containing protein [Pseudoflavonifractor capillosus]|uniref:ACT domain-containing protein n=1 Tax=Pseudoflavonifractor capillosus TaxID=106588 RepID=UPI001957DDF3|nr:ACT domain-containing protein [Pseudoflavonifractor capillosus]MBM6681853.1 ACT domain-containing protein [Pseudoflavonifractor capillosus]MBS6348426.1 ACT domain-containing protein [Oscillospiraceae bacterium]